MNNTLPTIVVNPQRETLKTGEYRIRCVDLTVQDSPFEPNRQQVKFLLEVLDPPYAGQRLVAFATLSTSPKSKLIRWAQVLLNRILLPNESLNLAVLIGCEAIAVIVARTSENGQYNKVEELLPLKRPAKAEGDALFSEP